MVVTPTEHQHWEVVMRAGIRRKFSMAGKALAFERANPSTDASHVGVVDRLADLVARVDAVLVREQNGKIGQRAAAERRREIREGLNTRLRHLVRVGKAAAKHNPALVGEFVAPPYTGPNRIFIGSARALVAQATTHRDALLDAGLGGTLLDDIAERIAAFEVASLGTDTGRRAHVEATATYDGLARECLDLVELLDGLNQVRFEQKPELLAAWKSARNVFGPFTRKEIEPETPVVGLLQAGTAV
jgi:hypothetical protein